MLALQYNCFVGLFNEQQKTAMKTTIKTASDELASEIKKNHNFLCGLELPDYKVSVYLTYLGGEKVHYHMFRNGELLFEGKDFRPSPLRNQDDIGTVIDLLGFLTCQPGDTDQDYFANYTPAQMDWAKSYDCEQLKGVVSDFEGDELYQVDAKEYFNNHFVR